MAKMKPPVHKRSPTFAAIRRYRQRGLHAVDAVAKNDKPVRYPCSPWPRNRGPLDYRTGKPIPIAHSKYILRHGKAAYRKALESGELTD